MALRFDCFLPWKHCYIIFQLSFCLSFFFPLSDVRCLKGKDKLEGESVMQMERLTVLAEVSLPSCPQFRNKCPLSSPGQFARLWGGFTQAVLPALKATLFSTHYTKQMVSFVFRVVEKWNGTLIERVGGFHTLLWLWCTDRDLVVVVFSC